jgi:putative tricarboxylic transport membrane protein
MLIAIGFAGCGLVLLVSGLRSSEVRGLVQLSEWTRSGGHILDVGLVIGGLVLLILLWDVVGFVIGGTLLMGGLTARFRGGHVVSSFVIALVACGAIDWSFRKLLLVPLPMGPLLGVIG